MSHLHGEPPRQRLSWVLWPCGLLVAACASFSSVQSADTLGRGQVQGAVEPGVWGAVTGRGLEMVPHVDGAVRVGVTERLDLGVRAGSSFLEAQGKVLLTPPGHRRLAVSLAPSVGGIFRATGLVTASLPVLIGLKLPGAHELVLGPRVQGVFAYDGAQWTTIVLAGSSVGFLWRITDAFGLLPEVAVLRPIIGAEYANAVVAGFDVRGVFVQLKLGLLFGRFRPVTDSAR